MEKVDVQKILEERNATHGDFSRNAGVSQDFKSIIKETFKHGNTNVLKADQKEALDMICLKLSRIITGNPNEANHWLDIAGYALLIANRLEADKAFVDPKTNAEKTKQAAEALRAVPRHSDVKNFTLPPAPAMPVHQSRDVEEPINSDGHRIFTDRSSYYDRQRL